MSKKHLHTYKRTDIGKKGKYIVFKCINCTHYVAPELLEGREALCPRCEEPFRVESQHMQLAMPHCNNCTQRREPANVEQTTEQGLPDR